MELFATKLKVASAIFLASFIVWLVLILLVAQPTDNIGRLQFSNFLILSLFLSSAIAASFSSMIIGLDLIEFKMRPMSLTKFRRGRLSIRTRKSRIASQKSKPRDLSLQLDKMPKDLSLQLEKMHISETKLEAEMPYLKEETVLPELTLSNEVVIEKPHESEKSIEEDAIQMRANVHSQPPEIETIQEPSYEREPLPTSAKRNSEVDSEKNKCPNCNETFTLALLSLEVRNGKTCMVKTCPHCFAPLESFEDKESRSAEVTRAREPTKRNKEELKSFFLFGETEFKGCKFKVGYLASLPKNKPIPDGCFGCPRLVECYQTL